MRIRVGITCLIVAVLTTAVYAGEFDPDSIKREWLLGSNNARKVFDNIIYKEVPFQIELDNLKNIEKLPKEFLKGKFTVIDIWATWCGPCLASISENNKIYSEYGEKINFVGICVPEGSENFEQVVKNKEVKYPVGIDADRSIIDYFKPIGYPTYHLIGPNGRLVVADISQSYLEIVLKKVIGNL